jgi:hypothetical protein
LVSEVTGKVRPELILLNCWLKLFRWYIKWCTKIQSDGADSIVLNLPQEVIMVAALALWF